MIACPKPIDLCAFEAPADRLEARYGLPPGVLFCKHCVISNQRPNSAVEYEHTRSSRKATIAFDGEGVCDACRFAEQKHGSIDWKDRENRLAALCDRFRSKSGYDCLLPGSGGLNLDVFLKSTAKTRGRSEVVQVQDNNFWVLAQTVPEARRLLAVYQRRLRSNLLAGLRPLAGARAEAVADGLGALIDGLYLREVLKSGPADRAAAVAVALAYLEAQLRA